ncbi:hypothetical protein Y032_0084g1765 [Ancylostoma ceylanicum]|uniref:Aquaporin-9 domain protein n=2 Tax=Ancylostoma ceylanicum TaxID=53326 RepID=A0A016TQQ9_9BILA|nr:hypothetical protein Y032_0084g1765 [Ancylostoma ceylanicum]
MFIAGTAMLCIGVATIVDPRNGIPPFLQPTLVGVLLMSIGMALGMNCGYAINPARDFGPRLLTLCVGYGWEVFSFRNYNWFWVPTLMPMVGAVVGAWIYEFFIGFHTPDEPEPVFKVYMLILCTFLVPDIFHCANQHTRA